MTIRANLPGFTENIVDKSGLITPSWGQYMHELFNRVGGDKQYNLGGTLTVNTTAVGNVGSGVDDLISYSLQKNTLLTTGDRLEVTAFGSQAANTNNKTIKLLLGSTVLFSTGAVASNGKDWRIDCTIIRTAEETQVTTAIFSGDTVLVTQTSDFVSGAEDFTTALAIKCTGEATATNDIIQKGLTINLFPR